MSLPLNVGLALGCGGSRGYAHCGVLKVLQREKIGVSAIAGISMGTIMGIGFAMTNGDALHLEHLILERFQRFHFRNSLRITHKGLQVNTAALESFLESVIPQRRLEDLPIPLRIVATDVRTGRLVSIDRGPVAPLLVAAVLSPCLNPPFPYEQYLLSDGALLTSLPLKEIEEMKPDIIIGVENENSVPKVPPPLPLTASFLPPFLFLNRHPFHANFKFVHSMNIQHAEGMRLSSLRTPSFIIRPQLEEFTTTDYRHAAAIIRRGEEAAEEALPRLRRFLEENRVRKEVAAHATRSVSGDVAVHTHYVSS